MWFAGECGAGKSRSQEMRWGNYTISCTCISHGGLLNVDFDSIGLGWYLRRCISDKLAGEYDTPGHGPHLSGKGLGEGRIDGGNGRISEQCRD